MLRRIALLGALLTVWTSVCDAGPVAWRTDLPAAQAEAERTGKLVLIHFWTERCGPCRLLDKRVFSLPGVASAIENHYVPVKVNASESMMLARTYNVTRVPTDVVTSPTGEVVQSFVSPATPSAYTGHVGKVAASYRSRTGGQFAKVASAAPVSGSEAERQAQTVAAAPPVDPAYAELVAKKSVPTIGAGQDSTSVSDTAGTTVNRYAVAAKAPEQQPFAPPPAPMAQQPSTPPFNPAMSNPYYQSEKSPAAPVVAAPAEAQPSPADPPIEAVAVQTAAIEEKQAATRAPAAKDLPPGSPPLGFEGYCPVTMKKEWRWAEGDLRWGAIHRGRTYLFASQSHRDTFLEDPDTYSPVLEGSDPVLAVDSNQSVSGTREYALEYEGRFYLFANEQTLTKFWSNAAQYARGVERVASRAGSQETLTR